MRTKLRNVRPNPFRDIDNYPIRRDKVDALKASMESTDFWNNLNGRCIKKSPTTIEIAYGHHRLAALKEIYGPNHEIDIITKNHSDGVMLKMMAAENLQEWQSDSSVTQETIRTTIRALGEGRITIPNTNPTYVGRSLRYAPSYAVGVRPKDSPGVEYTAASIAEFLGFNTRTVEQSLTALEIIERGSIRAKEYKGITDTAARYLNAGVNTLESAARKGVEKATATGRKEHAKRIEANLKSAKTEFARQIKERGGSAGDVARRLAKTLNLEDADLPDVNEGARSIWLALKNRYLPRGAKQSEFFQKLDEVTQYANHLEARNRDTLVKILEQTAEKFTTSAKALKKSRLKTVAPSKMVRSR